MIWICSELALVYVQMADKKLAGPSNPQKLSTYSTSDFGLMHIITRSE